MEVHKSTCTYNNQKTVLFHFCSTLIGLDTVFWIDCIKRLIEFVWWNIFSNILLSNMFPKISYRCVWNFWSRWQGTFPRTYWASWTIYNIFQTKRLFALYFTKYLVHYVYYHQCFCFTFCLLQNYQQHFWQHYHHQE